MVRHLKCLWGKATLANRLHTWPPGIGRNRDPVLDSQMTHEDSQTQHNPMEMDLSIRLRSSVLGSLIKGARPFAAEGSSAVAGILLAEVAAVVAGIADRSPAPRLV